MLQKMFEQAVLPVLRSPSAADGVRTVLALVAAGCQVVELTTSTPGWESAVTELADSPATVGVGTVTTLEDAERALAAGAGFLVSPFPVPDVAVLAAEHGALFIGGGFTPGELATGRSAGIAKVFPAHLGGPRYLRSLAPVLPGLRLVPTGGVGWDDVSDYLDAGAFAVGIGSGLDLPADELAAAFGRVRRSGRTP